MVYFRVKVQISNPTLHSMTLESHMSVPPTGMWSLQPSLAQDVEFLREICRVLVGLYRGVAFQ